MFKKYLLIIFIILFSNTYIYAETKENINYIDVYNKLMDKNYIIDDENFNDMNNIYKSLNEKQMRALSLKYKNDIDRYAANRINSLYKLYMDSFRSNGVISVYTFNTIDKYFMPDIKMNYITVSAIDYYDNILINEYPELVSAMRKYVSFAPAAPENDKKYDVMFSSLMEFHASKTSDIYDLDKELFYKYKGKQPVKVKGIFTLSNVNNASCCMMCDRQYHINRYLPKTNFTSYDKSFELKNLSIRPKKFTYSNNIYPNILSQGKFGEVYFDAEITLGMDSMIYLHNDDKRVALISVDEIKLNKVVSSWKYSETNVFSISNDFDSYELVSDDGYVNLRDAPNGKIIKKIKLKGNSGKYVYHHKGLLDFKDEEKAMFTENFDEQLYNKFKGYYSKINKLLNMPGSISGQWYRVVYIPSRDDLMLFLPDENYDFQIIGSEIYGYVHSSQLNRQ